MASTIILPYQTATFSVPASSTIATYGATQYSVDRVSTFSNYPPQLSNVFFGAGGNTASAFTVAASVTVSAGSTPVYAQVGVAPVIYERTNYQPTPGTLNATDTLTAALLQGGIVTSTTAAAVTANLELGATLDAAGTFAVGDSFDWSAINTGALNAFTVTASTGHTVVGAGAVALSTSGRFRTVKTAAATFVTYRL
ncbi:MAG TPA: hypothetical protein VF477_00480 [Mycobacterium sp.]